MLKPRRSKGDIFTSLQRVPNWYMGIGVKDQGTIALLFPWFLNQDVFQLWRLCRELGSPPNFNFLSWVWPKPKCPPVALEDMLEDISCDISSENTIHYPRKGLLVSKKHAGWSVIKKHNIYYFWGCNLYFLIKLRIWDFFLSHCNAAQKILISKYMINKSNYFTTLGNKDILIVERKWK